MNFLSFHRVRRKETWAATIYFLWIASLGIIINNTGGRTDIFLTLGVLPFSVTVSFGLTHFI